MTEEQKTSEPQPSPDLVQELQSFVDQLTEAAQSLWESEDSRKLRQEIGAGFTELGRQMDTAIKSAQESEAVRDFEEQVKETVQKARTSDIAHKIEQGLLDGLRELNEQITKLVEPKDEETPQA